MKTHCLRSLAFSQETFPCNLQIFFYVLVVCEAYFWGEAAVPNWSWKSLETRKCWCWSAWNQSENRLGSSWWGWPELGKKLQDICSFVSLRCANLNSVLKWANFEGAHDTSTFKALIQALLFLVLFTLHATEAEGDSARGKQTLFVCYLLRGKSKPWMFSYETALASLLSQQLKMQCCTRGLGCSTQLFEDSELERVYFSAWRTARFLFLLSLLSLKCSAVFCSSGALLLQWKPNKLCLLLEEKQKSSILTKNINIAMIFKMNNWTRNFCLNK